ncbi:MAG: hypothetical protein IH840_08375 [Candidatus Heimdallarchaeota archaeon]|nr:hypothetical protein [Candidatus Heimdallarchaeota archaeon]
MRLNADIPKLEDIKLLNYILENGVPTQTRIYQDLGWNNQSEVSKSLNRLQGQGYYSRQSKSVTIDGSDMLKLLKSVKPV